MWKDSNSFTTTRSCDVFTFDKENGYITLSRCYANHFYETTGYINIDEVAMIDIYRTEE